MKVAKSSDWDILNTDEYENVIDQLVYKLYDLSEEEIQTIESVVN